jgi:hypothetical protein
LGNLQHQRKTAEEVLFLCLCSSLATAEWYGVEWLRDQNA